MTIALSNLIVDDWRLLTTRVPTAGAGGERAMTAALVWHVKAVMERSWDVDCEYNREDAGDGAEVKRWRALPDEQTPPTVTPDLIVHRRGLPGPENNLVVIEVKKSGDIDRSEGRTSRGSLSSILDIQAQFRYQHAVLLNLGLTPEGPRPAWAWIEYAHRKAGPDTLVEVYGAEALAALWRRGRVEETRRYAPGE